jgi:2-iminobutanoate/2-iminopropanoate deaminase
MAVECRPVQVPEFMCEAYDYPCPSAFSRGTEVRLAGARMVFVSGTASVGPGGESLHRDDLRAQACRAFENARAVLRASGADWRNVVKTTIYLRDIDRDYAALNEVRCAYFREAGLEDYPASTCIEARLCRPELLVEMDMIAVVED